MNNDMLKKMLTFKITDGYCENTETIQDLKNNFYEILKLSKDVELNYENKISQLGLKLDILSTIICMKKLKDSKEDGLVLVEMIKAVTSELENLYKGDM